MDGWIKEESIDYYEVRESSQAPLCDLILEDPTHREISVLVPQVSGHGDCIHQVEENRDSPRREMKLFASRVRELEKEMDVDEMRIHHAYDHMDKSISLV